MLLAFVFPRADVIATLNIHVVLYLCSSGSMLQLVYLYSVSYDSQWHSYWHKNYNGGNTDMSLSKTNRSFFIQNAA